MYGLQMTNDPVGLKHIMYNTRDGIKIRSSILFSATTVTMKFTQSWEHSL